MPGIILSMSNTQIPVEHLVPGTRILVDGGSIVATVVSVEVEATGATIECDCGTAYTGPGATVTAAPALFEVVAFGVVEVGDEPF